MYLQPAEAQLALRLIHRSPPRGVVRTGRFEDERDRYAAWSPVVQGLGPLIDRLLAGLPVLHPRAAGRARRHPA